MSSNIFDFLHDSSQFNIAFSLPIFQILQAINPIFWLNYFVFLCFEAGSYAGFKLAILVDVIELPKIFMVKE